MTVDQAMRRKFLAKWHRRLALVAVVWLAVLAATGLAINHANDWGLDRHPLPEWLQNGVYGIETAEEIDCPPAVDAVACARAFAKFDFGEIRVLIGPERLLMVDAAGRLIESMPAATLGLRQIEAGFSDGRGLFLRGGGQTVRADVALSEWRALSPGEYPQQDTWDWQDSVHPETAITWERLLLDLHAARFLGPAAQVFTDLMAAFTLLLAVSGVWLYLVKRRRNGGERGGLDGDQTSSRRPDQDPEADR